MINYVYDYPKDDLYTYAIKVVQEMKKRNYAIKTRNNFYDYFNIDATTCLKEVKIPFENHHNNKYLIQCFYNLQEKYDRGQKDFSEEQYEKLEDFFYSKNKREGRINNKMFEKLLKTLHKEIQISVYTQLKNLFDKANELIIKIDDNSARRATAEEKLVFISLGLEKLIEAVKETEN